MKKRRICLAAAVLLTIGLLAGCGKGTVKENTEEKAFSPSMDKDAEAVIQVNGSWSNFEALEAVAEDWNEIYPNVSINYTKIDDYNKQLDTILSSDNKPDLVLFDNNAYYAEKEHVIEQLVDLSTIGLNTDVYQDGVLASSMNGEKMVTLDWGMQVTGFVVNETLLKNQGLEVPTTHEDFLKACDTLKEKGFVPIQGCYINVYSYLMKNDRDVRIAQEKDQDAFYERFAKEEEGCGSYFDPEFEAMFSFIEKGYLNHETDKGIEDIYDKAILHFFEGETPFFCTNAETVSGMKKRESKSETYTAAPFDYSFVSLPVESENASLSVSTLAGLAVAEGSANEDWAKEFLRFTCSEEELNKMAETKGVPSLTKSGNADKRFESLSTISGENRVDGDKYPVIALIEAPYDNTVWGIVEGDITSVEEAEAFFEKQLSENLNK